LHQVIRKTVPELFATRPEILAKNAAHQKPRHRLANESMAE
jgi:hypothetical protein